MIHIKNLTHLTRIVFSEKDLYDQIHTDDKEKWFFIFNQCMSRVSITHAEFLNDKRMSKPDAMDLWFDKLKKVHKVPARFFPDFGSKEKRIKKAKIVESKKELITIKQRKRVW